MSAVPLAIPIVWSERSLDRQQRSRSSADLRSDCLAQQEILR